MIQLPNQSLALGKPLGIQIGHRNRYKFCSYTTNAASQSVDIKLSLPANKKITIYWGDGASTVITGAVTTTTYSHTYTDVKTYNLTVTGDYNEITYLKYEDNTIMSIQVTNLPRQLESLILWGHSNLSGNGKNLPYSLKLFNAGNCHTFNFNIIDLHFIDYFQMFSGTIIGDITNFSNTLFYANIVGNNLISEYTGKTWTTNMSKFKLNPVSPGGLSSAEIDQLLIDLDEDLDWSGGGTITLTGTNAPRTSASDAAVNNIIAEGGTVICNS